MAGKNSGGCKVAKEAGISIGNLQYYFPAKNDLIWALVDFIVADYTGVLKRFLAIADPNEQFEAILSHDIRDLNTERTTVLFPELWSLANHDDDVASLLATLYLPVQEILVQVISKMNPELNDKQAELLSVYITSAIEGFTNFIGHGKPWEKDTEAFVAISIQAFQQLVMSGTVPEAS